MNYTNLFTSTAEYYAKYRDTYPRTFIEYIRSYYNLNGEGSLLDLGCGTGQLAIPLAQYFSEVVGIDPEAEMLAQARDAAGYAKVQNIRWLVGRAETQIPNLGFFRLTTIGTALHWMERDEVVRAIYDHTESKGGLVVATIGPKIPWTPDTKAPSWKMKLIEIIQRYLGPERRAGNGVYVRGNRMFEDVFRDSPFKTFEKYNDAWEVTRDIDAILGYSFSTSWGSRELFQGRAEAFAADVRKELLPIEPSGKFKETVFLEAYVMVRK